MTRDEYRILHSTLIEHYQFIEFHLEGIYAVICEKGFPHGLTDVEKHNISRLIQEIRKIEKERDISIILESDYKRLETICLRRNFWCHNCYVDIVFDKKTDVPKYEQDIKRLMEDMKEADMLRESLFQKKTQLLQGGRNDGGPKC